MLKFFRFLICVLSILSLATCIASCDKITPLIDKVEEIYNSKFGDEETPSYEECEHNYIGVLTYPTCVDQGYITFTCACGDSYVGNYIMAIGHVEVTDAAIPATCTTTGLTEGKHCSVCGKVTVAQQIAEATGHDYVNSVCRICSVKYYSIGLKYASNSDGTCYVSGVGTCTDTDIVIPTVSPDGETVIGIGASAFSYCTSLASVIIPDGVTKIEDSAFYGCSNLASVVIPKSITEIMGWSAFSGLHEDLAAYYKGTIAECSHIKAHRPSNEDLHRAPHYYYSETEPTEMGNYWHYVDGVPTIWYDYISYSLGLDYQEIDGSYTSYALVGIGSFKGKELVIPAEYNNCQVVSIRSQAFMNQTHLVSVVIPNTITEIGSQAFSGCTNLTTVYYSGISSEWDEVNTGDSDFLGATVYYYSETIPVEEGSFWHYVDGVPTVWVKYISIGLEYTSNGDGTCYVSGIGTCTDTDIVIPKVSPEGWIVTGIGDSAFRGNRELLNVIMPSSIKVIGNEAFADCWYLEKIDIPYGVEIIGEGAFSECSHARSLSLPETVTTIGDYAFSSCRHIQSLTIPSKVTKIGVCTFSACSGLSTIIVPDNITHIEGGAFAYTYNLHTVIISNSVTFIGSEVFTAANDNFVLYFEGTEEEWLSIDIETTGTFGNTDLLNAPRYYYSETQPTEAGTFWHYVDGVPTVWGS